MGSCPFQIPPPSLQLFIGVQNLSLYPLSRYLSQWMTCGRLDLFYQPAPEYHTKGCSRSSADSPGARTLVFAAFEPFSSCEFRASILARTPFCAILWRSPILCFSARERGSWSSRCQEGRGGRLLLKIPGGGGSPRRGGVSAGNSDWGAKYFLGGPEFSQQCAY